MHWGKKARVPFSLVAVMVLMFSAASAVYVKNIDEKRAGESISTPAQDIEQVAKDLGLDIQAQAYYIAEQSIERNFRDLGFFDKPHIEKINPDTQREFQVYMRDTVDGSRIGKSNEYSVAYDNHVIFVVMEEQNTRDLSVTNKAGTISTVDGQFGSEIDNRKTAQYGETRRTVYFRVTGEVTYKVTHVLSGKTVEKTMLFDKNIYSPLPLLKSSFDAFQVNCIGDVTDMGRLVKYIVQTLAQYRVLLGYASGRYSSLYASMSIDDVLTARDVDIATKIAILLMEVRYFGTYDKDFAKSFIDFYIGVPLGTYVAGGLLDKALNKLMEDYIINGFVDAADLFALYHGMDLFYLNKIDLGGILGQAIYAFGDKVVYDMLNLFWTGPYSYWVDPILSEPFVKWDELLALDTDHESRGVKNPLYQLLYQWVWNFVEWLGLPHELDSHYMDKYIGQAGISPIRQWGISVGSEGCPSWGINRYVQLMWGRYALLTTSETRDDPMEWNVKIHKTSVEDLVIGLDEDPEKDTNSIESLDSRYRPEPFEINYNVGNIIGQYLTVDYTPTPGWSVLPPITHQYYLVEESLVYKHVKNGYDNPYGGGPYFETMYDILMAINRSVRQVSDDENERGYMDTVAKDIEGHVGTKMLEWGGNGYGAVEVGQEPYYIGGGYDNLDPNDGETIIIDGTNYIVDDALGSYSDAVCVFQILTVPVNGLDKTDEWFLNGAYKKGMGHDDADAGTPFLYAIIKETIGLIAEVFETLDKSLNDDPELQDYNVNILNFIPDVVIPYVKHIIYSITSILPYYKALINALISLPGMTYTRLEAFWNYFLLLKEQMGYAINDMATEMQGIFGEVSGNDGDTSAANSLSSLSSQDLNAIQNDFNNIDTNQLNSLSSSFDDSQYQSVANEFMGDTGAGTTQSEEQMKKDSTTTTDVDVVTGTSVSGAAASEHLLTASQVFSTSGIQYDWVGNQYQDVTLTSQVKTPSNSVVLSHVLTGDESTTVVGDQNSVLHDFSWTANPSGSGVIGTYTQGPDVQITGPIHGAGTPLHTHTYYRTTKTTTATMKVEEARSWSEDYSACKNNYDRVTVTITLQTHKIVEKNIEYHNSTDALVSQTGYTEIENSYPTTTYTGYIEAHPSQAAKDAMDRLNQPVQHNGQPMSISQARSMVNRMQGLISAMSSLTSALQTVITKVNSLVSKVQGMINAIKDVVNQVTGYIDKIMDNFIRAPHEKDGEDHFDFSKHALQDAWLRALVVMLPRLWFNYDYFGYNDYNDQSGTPIICHGDGGSIPFIDEFQMNIWFFHFTICFIGCFHGHFPIWVGIEGGMPILPDLWGGGSGKNNVDCTRAKTMFPMIAFAFWWMFEVINSFGDDRENCLVIDPFAALSHHVKSHGKLPLDNSRGQGLLRKVIDRVLGDMIPKNNPIINALINQIINAIANAIANKIAEFIVNFFDDLIDKVVDYVLGEVEKILGDGGTIDQVLDKIIRKISDICAKFVEEAITKIVESIVGTSGIFAQVASTIASDVAAVLREEVFDKLEQYLDTKRNEIKSKLTGTVNDTRDMVKEFLNTVVKNYITTQIVAFLAGSGRGMGTLEDGDDSESVRSVLKDTFGRFDEKEVKPCLEHIRENTDNYAYGENFDKFVIKQATLLSGSDGCGIGEQFKYDTRLLANKWLPDIMYRNTGTMRSDIFRAADVSNLEIFEASRESSTKTFWKGEEADALFNKSMMTETVNVQNDYMFAPLDGDLLKGAYIWPWIDVEISKPYGYHLWDAQDFDYGSLPVNRPPEKKLDLVYVIDTSKSMDRLGGSWNDDINGGTMSNVVANPGGGIKLAFNTGTLIHFMHLSSAQWGGRGNSGVDITPPRNIVTVGDATTGTVTWLHDAPDIDTYVRVTGECAAHHAIQVTQNPSSANGFTTKVRSGTDCSGNVYDIDMYFEPFQMSGTYTSEPFTVEDADNFLSWGTVTWTADQPAGTSIAIQVRTGNTATPDGSWSAWTTVPNGGSIGQTASYVQYRALLDTTDNEATPVLKTINIAFSNSNGKDPYAVVSDLNAILLANKVDFKYTIYLLGAGSKAHVNPALASDPNCNELVEVEGMSISYDGDDDSEMWGPGVAEVVANHPWEDGYVRAVIPVSDEGPYYGCTPGGLLDGADSASIDRAVAACDENDVQAFPFWCGPNLGVKGLMDTLASGTSNGKLLYSYAGWQEDFLDAISMLVDSFTVTATAGQEPFTTMWDVHVKGMFKLHLCTDRLSSVTEDGQHDKVWYNDTIRLDFNFTVVVYSAWNLTGVDYPMCRGFFGEKDNDYYWYKDNKMVGSPKPFFISGPFAEVMRDMETGYDIVLDEHYAMTNLLSHMPEEVLEKDQSYSRTMTNVIKRTNELLYQASTDDKYLPGLKDHIEEMMNTEGILGHANGYLDDNDVTLKVPFYGIGNVKLDMSEDSKVMAYLENTDDYMFNVSFVYPKMVPVFDVQTTTTTTTTPETVIPGETTTVTTGEPIPLDIVFVVDSSRSIKDEMRVIKDNIDAAVTTLRDEKNVDLEYRIGLIGQGAKTADYISPIFGSDPKVVELTHGYYNGAPLTARDGTTILKCDGAYDSEMWGPVTTAICSGAEPAVASFWREGSKRVIVAISDECAFGGNTAYHPEAGSSATLNQPGDDTPERDDISIEEAKTAAGKWGYELCGFWGSMSQDIALIGGGASSNPSLKAETIAEVQDEMQSYATITGGSGEWASSRAAFIAIFENIAEQVCEFTVTTDPIIIPGETTTETTTTITLTGYSCEGFANITAEGSFKFKYFEGTVRVGTPTNGQPNYTLDGYYTFQKKNPMLYMIPDIPLDFAPFNCPPLIENAKFKFRIDCPAKTEVPYEAKTSWGVWLLQQAQDLVADIDEAMHNYIRDLLTKAANKYGDEINSTLSFLNGIKSGLIGTMGKVKDNLTAVKTWIDNQMDNITNILNYPDRLLQNATMLVNNYTAKIEDWINGKVNMIQTIVQENVTKFMDNLLNKTLDLLPEQTETPEDASFIDRMLGSLKNKLLEVITSKLTDVKNMIVNKINGFVSDFLNNLKDKVLGYLNVAKDWVNGMITKLQNLWDGIKTKVLDAIHSVVDPITSKIDEVNSKLDEYISVLEGIGIPENQQELVDYIMSKIPHLEIPQIQQLLDKVVPVYIPYLGRYATIDMGVSGVWAGKYMSYLAQVFMLMELNTLGPSLEHQITYSQRVIGWMLDIMSYIGGILPFDKELGIHFDVKFEDDTHWKFSIILKDDFFGLNTKPFLMWVQNAIRTVLYNIGSNTLHSTLYSSVPYKASQNYNIIFELKNPDHGLRNNDYSRIYIVTNDYGPDGGSSVQANMPTHMGEVAPEAGVDYETTGGIFGFIGLGNLFPYHDRNDKIEIGTYDKPDGNWEMRATLDREQTMWWG